MVNRIQAPVRMMYIVRPLLVANLQVMEIVKHVWFAQVLKGPEQNAATVVFGGIF